MHLRVLVLQFPHKEEMGRLLFGMSQPRFLLNPNPPCPKKNKKHAKSVVGIGLTLASRMGELEPWIDENFVRNLWFQMGEQVNVKMIRDKFSG